MAAPTGVHCHPADTGRAVVISIKHAARGYDLTIMNCTRVGGAGVDLVQLFVHGYVLFRHEHPEPHSQSLFHLRFIFYQFYGQVFHFQLIS